MANIFGKQMANREVCDLVFVDYKTQKPFLFCDYANTSSQELTGENVFAYGGKSKENYFLWRKSWYTYN